MTNNIGSALAEHHMLVEAMPYFERAMMIDRRYLSPRRNLAKVLRELKRWEALETLLHETAKIAPDDSRLYGLNAG